MSEWTTLEKLRPGAVFVTRDGTLAVKSEYYYPNAQSECTLLESGEYAHFPEKNDVEVREIPLALIAAAPDLLAACKALLISLEGAHELYGMAIARRAIARAEGEGDGT